MRGRALSEKEAYNDGLQRELYDKIFGHCGFYADLHRKYLLMTLMRNGDGGDVLELGSQSWETFIHDVGIKPRFLYCINISEVELENGRRKAEEIGLDVRMQMMDAHHLDFPDDSFNVVYGGGILHHLDFEVALREIARVLRPGGTMVFQEPLGGNPIGKIIRALTPRARTPDETPLDHTHISLLEHYFDCEFHYEQFLSVPLGVLSGLVTSSPENWLNRMAFAIDQRLIRLTPGLGPFYRHVLIAGHSKSDEKLL
jgi:SAM-dependent methyltransferase